MVAVGEFLSSLPNRSLPLDTVEGFRTHEAVDTAIPLVAVAFDLMREMAGVTVDGEASAGGTHVIFYVKLGPTAKALVGAFGSLLSQLRDYLGENAHLRSPVGVRHLHDK